MGFVIWASWKKKCFFTFKRKREELPLALVDPGLLYFNLEKEEIVLKNRYSRKRAWDIFLVDYFVKAVEK